MKSEIRKGAVQWRELKLVLLEPAPFLKIHFESLIDEQGKNFFEKTGGI
ncbi:hypothetical protein [Oceanobacillus neutriphilus]|nr:hypothetical protein [Oceanobacillus neutriphilus]